MRREEKTYTASLWVWVLKVIPMKLCLSHWIKYKILRLTFEALHILAPVYCSRSLSLSLILSRDARPQTTWPPFIIKCTTEFCHTHLLMLSLSGSLAISLNLNSTTLNPYSLSPGHTGLFAVFLCWACSCPKALALPIPSAWNILSQL